MNDSLLPLLLTPLLAHGHHPPSLQKANGIVLAKPGKPDYRTPASFRIIVLLETVSKILERLVALRLASSARTLGLLHPNQCGSLAGPSCFDAAATLTYEVRLLQAASLQVSTLFLDVKGGFDNVCANKLASILRRGGVPAYLVAWIKSFLSQRKCCLIIQGSPRTFDRWRSVPLKALLFLLFYLCCMFQDFTLQSRKGSPSPMWMTLQLQLVPPPSGPTSNCYSATFAKCKEEGRPSE